MSEVQNIKTPFNKNEYMKIYMREYSKTHPRKTKNTKIEYCHICKREYSQASMINHLKSIKHKYKVLCEKETNNV
jgi:hypothetical protein